MFLWRQMPNGRAGTLVLEEETAHQLFGIEGNLHGFQMLLQGWKEHPCPVENGQYISSCVHHQDGRDGVPCLEQPKQRVLAMVHGEGHLCTRTTLSREAGQHR